MYLITGITGKVGGAAATNLLKAGKKVRAIVRDTAKASTWADQGVELVQGEWQDDAAMTRALEGVDGVYLMMPPSQTPSRDFREARAVIASYQAALAAAPPPKVVALSSIGSERDHSLGLITSTHLLEQGLADLPCPLAFVRAGSFFENNLYGLQTGQGGTLPVFYAPTDRAVPMIATADIGAEVAKLLLENFTGRRIIELGTRISPGDVATALGRVLGREVHATALPRESWSPTLQHMGLPAEHTWAFEQMAESINSGWIDFGVAGTEAVAGTTSAAEVFAKASAAK